MEWQPIETAPQEKILVSDGINIDVAYWDYEDWCAPHSSANSIPYKPTHWMPLPGSPGVANNQLHLINKKDAGK